MYTVQPKTQLIWELPEELTISCVKGLWVYGMGRAAALLWYLLNPLFCEPARLCLRLELFTRKFSLSFFFSSPSGYHSLGCYLTVSAFRLSSGHSGLVLNLSMHPTPPPLPGAIQESLDYFSSGSCG